MQDFQQNSGGRTDFLFFIWLCDAWWSALSRESQSCKTIPASVTLWLCEQSPCVTIYKELCSRESYQCSSRSVHPSCPVIMEGQKRCCTVNQMVHVWRLCKPPSGQEPVLKENCWISFACSSGSVRRSSSCAVIEEGEHWSYRKSTATCLSPVCMQWATERTRNSAQWNLLTFFLDDFLRHFDGMDGVCQAPSRIPVFFSK